MIMCCKTKRRFHRGSKIQWREKAKASHGEVQICPRRVQLNEAYYAYSNILIPLVPVYSFDHDVWRKEEPYYASVRTTYRVIRMEQRRAISRLLLSLMKPRVKIKMPAKQHWYRTYVVYYERNWYVDEAAATCSPIKCDDIPTRIESTLREFFWSM